MTPNLLGHPPEVFPRVPLSMSPLPASPCLRIPQPLPPRSLVTILPRVTRKTYCQVINAVNGRILVKRARWCDSFTSKARGFTFRRGLAPGEGLVLVESSDSRVNSGITMLFCFIDLGVIWVDTHGMVVDTVVAKPWRPSYLPQAPARYAIEADPGIIEYVKIGDRVEFADLAEINETGLGVT